MKEERERRKTHFTVTGVLFGIAILTLLFFVCVYTDVSELVYGYPGERHLSLMTGWRDQQNELQDLTKLAKADTSDPTIDLINTLPAEILSGDTLNICSHNLFFDVYFDGQCVYRYIAEENLTGYGTGHVYHNIQITPEDAGKEIRIVADLEHGRENGGRFADIMICEPHVFYHFVFRDTGMAFLMSGLIVFMGMVILAIHFCYLREKSTGPDLFYLGLCVLIIGNWTLIETNLLQIMVGLTNALRVLDYLLLIFMIYPVVRFVNSITKKRNPFYPKLAFLLLTVTISGALIARIFFGMDMHNMMGAFMVYYAISILVVGFMLIQNRIYCKRRGISEGLKFFYAGAGFLLAGGMIDVLCYELLGKTKSNNGTFLRIGLIIFIFTMMVQIMESYISEEMRRRAEERKLINYSYYDEMTGVKNRRALHEFEEKVLDRSKPYGFVMCDINGLKSANDNEGHEAGDRMIRDVADALSEIYGNDQVYRMGGDEFGVYYTEGEEELKQSVEKLRALIQKKERSASLGYAFCTSKDTDPEEVRKEADRMMYQDKDHYYSGKNERRKR